MAKLTKEQVEKVAHLARIGLTLKDTKLFQEQLSDILTYVEKLNGVDTSKVSMTSQVTGLTNVFREDEASPSLSVEDVLSNAPKKKNNLFIIPAVFDQE
ncbi:MAG TPA: Asp-tRNA(Asn)/Glu-tRNA(Gln) amidotransferase subunit GatC [Patescibacteria group bacterium]|nr:Asp-tRNA(Asn)/Glu-tRNA(Gln) amidotransferase subunit GatC [Patescibacteria group bacterium]